MSDTAEVAQLKAMISAIVAHGKTGNMRAVVQTLNDFEKKTKNIKYYPRVQELQAEAFRHALEPFGVAKKFKEVESMLSRIEQLLRSKANSEDMQEIYSEALNAGIFHYIMNTQDKEINRSLVRLGNFARKHQTNPFVQFNFAMSLSKVAEYFAGKDDKEVTYNILYEIIGIVTFFPGKEILTQVVDGLLKCIIVAGNKLSLNELEDVSCRIDEFINFTNEFEIQQKLTTCQGKIFQFIAGQRMRQGYSPDGQVQIKYKK